MSDDQQLPDPKAFLPEKLYLFLKYLVLVALPAVGAFYFALAQIWGFPNSQGVNGTINVVCVLLGLLLGFSTRQYNKDVRFDGSINIVETEDKKKLVFDFADPHAIEDKSEITLRVNKN